MNDENTVCDELLLIIEKYEEQIFSGEMDFMQTEIFWNDLNRLIGECGNDMSPQILRQVDVMRHSFF